LDVELLAIPKKKAQEEFDALKQVIKQGRKTKLDEIYSDYQKLYGHLRHGKKVIDVYESFEKAGLNEEGHPKLAIVRADSKIVVCRERVDGSVKYYHDNEGKRTIQRIRWSYYGDKDDITLPRGTFEWKKNESGYAQYSDVQTIVPVIPAKILVNEVKVLLKNFHILWEVEEWKPVAPRDPILLRRLTPNLFGVLATWNLTKLERAVIRGRIQ